MKVFQLFCGAVALVVVTSGCQRSAGDAKQNANAAAAEIKSRAAVARDRLSDSWITTQIQSKYVGDREIHARDIDVSTHDGVVTLKGHVLNEPLRQLAVVLARNTDGVKQVVDQLGVQIAAPVAKRSAPSSSAGAVATSGTSPAPPATTDSTDTRITSAIQSKYFLDDRLKGRHVDVSTSNGVVTLNGDVADDTERGQALLLARTTDGVRRVEDHLTVAAASAPAPASDDALISRVQSQLSADGQTKAASIQVTATNGVVVLNGTVPNLAAKQRALMLARTTDGVTQVIDEVHVESTKR